MAGFYSGNVMPSVCGKSVKVYHSQSYPTIQVRSSELMNLHLNQILKGVRHLTHVCVKHSEWQSHLHW